MGLGGFQVAVAAVSASADGAGVRLPQFKQYREADGRFHFKLVDGDGRLLLQGDGHASPRDCGQVIARLKREGAAALQEMEARAVGLLGERIGTLGEDLADVQEIASALAQLVEGEA